ncbi:hypothetical protein [Aestuariivivens sediminis]|uniref:hypothetical protein n=1 Tax=Aestuariivivens sediminis TaxID=2913557 RepID=UPI001F5AFBA9|nr:hypothetical protein [Aestuariivivens sediminis]
MNDGLFFLYLIISVGIGALAGVLFMKLKNKGLTDLWHERMAQKDKDLGSLEMAMNKEIDHYRSEIKVLQTKLTDFDALKNEKSKLEVELKNTEKEKNALKDENTSLKKDEQNRIRDHQKAIEATITLQSSLEKEKERLNDERVQQEKERLEALRETWANHEKDVENHIRLICKNNVITYIEQNDFPYAGRKPDNTIEILDQLIIFDAKSPANDDLKNFPKYIKSQTENLKKYTKHENVKNDIFLVIPSNTLQVIKDVIYNIGDYNVYIISKDALEPIILSLKKIEDYEFADKLSPEDRDNICRIIGKFAHTTKRKIQIEQFFASEFLDILQKSKTLLPTEILKSVIEFENAEKLNPPMEKRKKPILTKDLIDQTNQLKKEIELRNIPQIEAKITFKEDH